MPIRVVLVDDHELVRAGIRRLLVDSGYEVVAEGVETLEDWILLRNLGCGQAQGYLLGRPMPGGELVAWWESNRTRIRQLAGRAG